MVIIGSSALMPNPSLLKIGRVMDATDLKVFEAVARHGSMSRAAAELNTVQSNVTARVRALELELGVLLFERHARGVKLTPAGRRMLPFSARISRLLSDAKAAARDDGVPSGVLEVGTLETTVALRLPPVLASFTKAYPKVRPVIRPERPVASSRTLLNAGLRVHLLRGRSTIRICTRSVSFAK